MKYIFLILVLIFTPLTYSSAQVDLAIGNDGLIIETEPNYFKPFSEVTASLNDYSLAYQVSSIKWQIDNKQIPEAENQRSITFKLKAQNKPTVVTVTAQLIGGGTQTTKKVITPAYLDIVVEPQTRTPSFYLGRSLPSIDSRVNLIALLDGDALTSPTNLIYNWRLNNKVLEGGQTRGKNTITITMPMDQTSIVTLDVTNLTGDILARRSVFIRNSESKVNFYETNSLYGQSQKAITNLNLVGDSASIQAEPYYLDIATYNNPEFLEWKLGGIKSPASTGNPYQITLARDGGNGSIGVDFHVRNLTQLLQGSRGSFRVNY